MSRHKLVKNLNLNEELEDFEGGASYENDSEVDISVEDKEQLQKGTATVRQVLGPDVAITDEEIQDSLWHYYYDVEKTVNYILNQKTGRNKKAKRNLKQNDNQISNAALHEIYFPPPGCKGSFSVREYFEDAPWLNIPEDRRGEILIEPLYPRGRLLGGSPSQKQVSKIAALTAARKKKANEGAKPMPQRSTTSVLLLDKLTGRTSSNVSTDSTPSASGINHSKRIGEEWDIKTPASTHLNQKDEQQISDSKPDMHRHKRVLRQSSNAYSPSPPVPVVAPVTAPVTAPVAAPSNFAKALFGNSAFRQKQPPVVSFQPYYTLHQGPTLTNFEGFTGPSPDDIVLKAQNSKGTKPSKPPTKVPNDSKALNGTTQRLKDLVINDPPKAKSKNLNVLAEFGTSNSKNTANFVVIGHVDAGKSTLMGRLLYDLKVVDQRTIDRYRKDAENIGKSSFAFAWVLDQGSEERARGVTIDIAMNKFETPQTRFTILDAPGHRDFIPNMIAGASQADFAVLVIDASQGNFESGIKGQTKEHALLVRSMGVTRIVVAVNKLDTVSWSQDRYSEISTQISAFLTAAGFLAKNIAFVPCSGLTGDNIVYESQNPLSKWYTGPTLLSLLESSEPVSRALEKPLRLTINDIFRGGVTNPLSISGRLDAGSVQVGDTVLAMPAAESALIRAIEVDSASSDWAVAGQNVVLHLSDIEAKHLKPGDVICSPMAPVTNVSSFTMKLLAFEHVMPMHVEIHRGRLHVPGRISRLVAVLDKSSGAVASGGKKVRIVKPGGIARVVVEMDDSVPLETGAKVVLRNGGSTVATGVLE